MVEKKINRIRAIEVREMSVMKEKRLIGLVLGLLMCIPIGSYLLYVVVAPPVPIPSTISTQLVYENTTINQNSDITIQDGGVLVLINSDLIMCSNAQTTYKIKVQKGGSLFILNQSEVRASNPNYGYDFKAEQDSTFVAELSEINDCGRDNNGIWLRTDNATIVNCSIQTGYNKGINIDDCSPRVVGCYIEDASANGIYIEGKSNPHVYNNELVDNENGIYILNNLEEYSVSSSYPDWVQVHSNTEIQSNSYITVEPTTNALFDAALLASGTSVEYSGANCGIWGDNGKPAYMVGAMLDDDPASYATTTLAAPDQGGMVAYFSLDLNRVREIKKIRIEFIDEVHSITDFGIYQCDLDHAPGHASNDWTEFATEIDFGSYGTSGIEYDLGEPVSTRFVMLKATDFLPNEDKRPMISAFSIFTEDKVGSVLTDPITLGDGETWGHLYIDRDISEKTDVLVSVCHQSIENGDILPVNGLENIPIDSVDLTDIDSIQYPELILRFILNNEGTESDYPRLYGFKLLKNRNMLREIDWKNSTSDAYDYQNTEVTPGEIHLEPEEGADYNSFTFDHYTQGNLDGQDGWDVTGAGASSTSKVVRNICSGGDKAMVHEDMSYSGSELVTFRDLPQGIEEGIVEFDLRIEELSKSGSYTDTYGNIILTEIGGSSTEGIRLRYVGQPSSTINSLYGVNYLEYYSPTGWIKIDHQLNRSIWYHIQIEFDAGTDQFYFSIDNEEKQLLSASSIDVIEQFKVKSNANVKFVAYFDEIRIHSGEFETISPYAFLNNFTLTEGERIEKVYIECSNLNDDLHVTLTFQSENQNINTGNTISGNVITYHDLKSTNGTIPLHGILQLSSSDPLYSPVVKRIWFQFGHVVSHNIIRCIGEQDGKGFKVSDSDPWSIRDNTVEDCDYGMFLNNITGLLPENRLEDNTLFGIYLKYSDNVILDGVNLVNNHKNLDCQNSDVVLYDLNVTYTSSGLHGFEASGGSRICVVDPTYSFSTNRLFGDSTISTSHILDVGLSNYQPDESSDRSHAKLFGHRYDDSGYEDELEYIGYSYDGTLILSENVTTGSGRKTVSPNYVSIDEKKNRFYITMNTSRSLSVIYGTDSDGDSISDKAELFPGKYQYEPEYIESSNKIISSGVVQLTSGGTDSIARLGIPIHEEYPGNYRYSIAIRARNNDQIMTTQSFNIRLWDNNNYDWSFSTLPIYSWYQTNWFKLPQGKTVITGLIKDLNPPSRVIVDKYVLLLNGTNDNPPVLSSPLIPDIDEDDLLDGYERTPSGFYIEAEHKGKSPFTVCSDIEASNSKYIRANNQGQYFIQFNIKTPTGSSGRYYIYVRAKLLSELYTGQFQINIIGKEYLTESGLETSYKWFKFVYDLSDDTTYICRIMENSGAVRVGIDKICVVRESEVTLKIGSHDYPIEVDLTQTTSVNLDPIDIPTWGNIREARMKYYINDEQQTVEDLNLNSVIGFDVFNNLIVYTLDGQNQLKAINLSTNLNYDPNPPITGYKPSLWNGEVVYQKSSGTNSGIYYSDFRKDPEHVNGEMEILLSDEGGSSYPGRDPEIYDGTVAWVDSGGQRINVRMMDSWHFMTVPESGTIPIRTGSYISVYDTSVAWVEEFAPYFSRVKVAYLGLLADKQEGNEKYSGLSPHIKTLERVNDYRFKQVSMFGTKLGIISQQAGSERIEIYDMITESFDVIYSSNNINVNSKIFLYGNHIMWTEGEAQQYTIKMQNIYADSAITVGTSDVNIYSFYGGQALFINNYNIKRYDNDFTLSLAGVELYHNDNVCQQVDGNIRQTWDFSDELNNYLIEEQVSESIYDIMEGFSSVQFTIGSDLGVTLNIEEITIEIDGVTDPFSSDFDFDGLLDGTEVLDYHRKGIHETEDTIDFIEWLEPSVSKSHSTWSGLASMYYKNSPMFNMEGVDLASGTVLYGMNDEEEPLYTNMKSFYRFDVPEVEHSGLYSVEVIGNERMMNTFVDLEGMTQPEDRIMGAGSEHGFFGLEKNLRDEDYYLSDEEELYVKLVLNEIVLIEHSGISGEDVEIKEEVKDFDILSCKVGRYCENAAEYYDDESENDEMFLVVSLNYDARVNYGGADQYTIEVRCDLDLLPDDLDPALKDDLGSTLVPDGFEVDRFGMIRLINMDRIILSGRGLDPTVKDTDDDGLSDLSEYLNQTCPLNKDSDADGITDNVEVEVELTDPIRRDSDGDNIRDGIELSYTLQELETVESTGSWYERKARNGDYFDFELITNLDADAGDYTDPLDVDSDDDGLPDGIIDGWRYYGEYYQGEWDSYYSEEFWKAGFNYDGLVQVFEGEDLNLDGDFGSTWTTWGFDGITFEFTGTGGAETNPKSADTDSDNVPDGYEIWYSTREPFVHESGNLILNPKVGDSSLDKDPDGFEVIGQILPDDGDESIDGSNIHALAQKVDIPDPILLKQVVRIGVKTDFDPKCIELWTGSISGPITKVRTFRNAEEDENSWFNFKVDQGYFLNGLEAGYCFFIVIPYTGISLKWYTQATPPPDPDLITYSFGGSQWTPTQGYDLSLTYYSYDLTGDGISNLEEYIVGTHPKNTNTDRDIWGDNDDGVVDGIEVKTFRTDVTGKVLARTNIVDGALGYTKMNLTTLELNGKYIDYNEDPLRSSSPYHSIYRYDYESKGNVYQFESWTNRECFRLKDGTIVTRSIEGSDIYLIVWDSVYLDLDNLWMDEFDNYHVNCSYLRFQRDEQITSGTYLIEIAYRGMDIYFSDPNRWDSDNDGALDGLEIDWNENSDGGYTGRELTDLGTDCVYNVRDPDSDNDGVKDGEEPQWDEDITGLGLDTDTDENMIDPDSDGDGLWDGWEHDWNQDSDFDGLVNMVDPDSDGDGLCDGWVDGYIWDPKADEKNGLFVQLEYSTTYSPTDNTNHFDDWEGEDQNRNGIKDDDETDPLLMDTDRDGLWDGYDIVYGESIKLGELYEPGSTEMNDFFTGFVYTRTYVDEQSSNTSQLNVDTDFDLVTDGQEVLSYGLYLSMKIFVPSTSGIVSVSYENIRSDPLEADTDGDGIDDHSEYSNHTLPVSDDSDGDGLTDDIEILSSGTLPNNCDTDGDQLLDGGLDGWIFDTTSKKCKVSSNQDDFDEVIDHWEGEDINLDGNKDSTETDPNNKDSDNDYIDDLKEYYFYLQNDVWTDPTIESDYDGDGIINPLDIDSDDDGLEDGEEDYDYDGEIDAEYGSCDDNPIYSSAMETNPFNNDSDEDGIIDSEDCLDYYDEIVWKADYDGDGLINAQDQNSDNDNYDDKSLYELEPLVPGTPNSDLDGDGLLNCQEDTTYPFGEYNEGDISNFDDSDTDGDGLNDFDDLNHGADPKLSHSDNDDIDDYDEVMTYHTYPWKTDSDNDGFNDYYEIFTLESNPMSRDSDCDGLYDYDLKEGNLDSDSDGIYNLMEIDSDNDGVTDHDETFIYFLNSINNDYDFDSLIDGDELFIHYTNPKLMDTDEDTLSDNEEILYGTNPNDQDSDEDYYNDDEDFEPMVKNCELMFSIRELIVNSYSGKEDKDNGEDLFIILKGYGKFDDNLESEWNYLISFYSKSWFFNEVKEKTSFKIGTTDYYDSSNVFSWYNDDKGERWVDDSVKTRNEIIDKWSISTNNLPNSLKYIKFILYLYDSDLTSKPDLIDISPEDNYPSKDNEIWFNDDIRCKGRVLEIIFDISKSIWFIKNNDQQILEGFTVTKNINNEFEYSSLDNDEIGLCSSKGSNNQYAIIYFDIFPFIKNNYKSEIKLNFLPGDNDHDKLTAISEYQFWNTNNNEEDGYDSDLDGLFDWFEIRYKLNPNLGLLLFYGSSLDEAYNKIDNKYINNIIYDIYEGPEYYDSINDEYIYSYCVSEIVDYDYDGFDFISEQYYYDIGFSGTIKDIGIEVDRMVNGDFPYGDYEILPFIEDNIINKIIIEYNNHDFNLIIDDGWFDNVNKYIEYCDIDAFTPSIQSIATYDYFASLGKKDFLYKKYYAILENQYIGGGMSGVIHLDSNQYPIDYKNTFIYSCVSGIIYIKKINGDIDTRTGVARPVDILSFNLNYRRFFISGNRKSVDKVKTFMHELGHANGINRIDSMDIDKDGIDEKYCSNNNCIMSKNMWNVESLNYCEGLKSSEQPTCWDIINYYYLEGYYENGY